ncbi:MAG: penicillin-binding protein 2 [Candidatus Niyogibacteria bacterium]|nr:penicillin-binding protein 2 [Candidatus Niyogibacteria bacterium]
MANSKEIGKQRIGWVFLFLVLLGAVITGRLFFLQAVSGSYYRTLADRQAVKTNSLQPRRGSIYFQGKNGELVTAADTKTGYNIYINPRELLALNTDVNALYEKLNAIVPIDRAYFDGRMARTDDPYEEVALKVDESVAGKVRALDIKGVGAKSVEWRNYPAGETASHVIGFLGYNGEKLEGRYGIERQFQDILLGSFDPADDGGWFSGFSHVLATPQEGRDIVLTLNIDAQVFLEKTLANTLKEFSGQSAAGIVLEPKTGKIIAMAAVPNFDPNNYQQEKNINVFVNPLVEHIYEFGSVFKTLTMAAALDKGAVTPTTKYFDSGFLVLNGRRISNFDGKGRGEITMQHVLNESLNTGAVFAMQQLGKENFYNYFVNYGLDTKTNIELPGEVLGSLSNLDTTRDIEYATASYGQGVAVTGLEAARAFASLGNGGLLMRPYIVDRIVRPGETDLATAPKSQGKVLKTETSETISRMLVTVVDEALLGGTVKDPHYTLAAKTGTAYIPNAEGKYSDEMVHSIFGYAPGFDPRFLVFLYIERPQGVKYASQSLGLPMINVMRFLLNYYNVPPDR